MGLGKKKSDQGAGSETGKAGKGNSDVRSKAKAGVPAFKCLTPAQPREAGIQ